MASAHFDHFAAHVMTAVGTDDVRRQDLAALRADLQLARLQGIVGASGTGASVGVLAFRDGHVRFSSRLSRFRQNIVTGDYHRARIQECERIMLALGVTHVKRTPDRVVS